MNLYYEYMKNQTSDNLMSLYNQMRPVIMPEVNKWSSVNLPKSLVEAEAFKHFNTAVHSFSPTGGAKISTHVRNQIKPINRFGATYSGLVKIPENRVFKIKEYKDAIEHLDINGEPVSTDQISSYLQWSPKEVERMQAELRTDLLQSGNTFDSSVSEYGSRELGFKNIYHTLTPKQKLVYDYTNGTNGKQSLSVGEIAAKMGVSSPAVTKIRKSIALKMQKSIYF